jgi:hypothetical protein
MSTATAREPAQNALMREDFARYFSDIVENHSKRFFNTDSQDRWVRSYRPTFQRKKAKGGVIHELPNEAAFSGLQFLPMSVRKFTHPIDNTTIGEQNAPHVTCVVQC